MTQIQSIVRLSRHEYELLQRAIDATRQFLIASKTRANTVETRNLRYALAAKYITPSRLSLVAGWLRSARLATTKLLLTLSGEDLRLIRFAAGYYGSVLRRKRFGNDPRSAKSDTRLKHDIYRLRLIREWLQTIA